MGLKDSYAEMLMAKIIAISDSCFLSLGATESVRIKGYRWFPPQKCSCADNPHSALQFVVSKLP
ncbi:MAG: hypothetical protein QNJ68_07815 [Microcoleaceae cyanobacterium MO_207.B10]|nr:hypothetical protein [Microcoleaceae cyanobacterium MO_207.B10]